MKKDRQAVGKTIKSNRIAKRVAKWQDSSDMATKARRTRGRKSKLSPELIQSERKSTPKVRKPRANDFFYAIDKILKRRILKNGQEQVLVSWQGYSNHSNRWICRKKIKGLNNANIEQLIDNLEPEPEKPVKSAKSIKKRKLRIKRNKKGRRGMKPGELIVLQSDSQEVVVLNEKENGKVQGDGREREGKEQREKVQEEKSKSNQRLEREIIIEPHSAVLNRLDKPPEDAPLCLPTPVPPPKKKQTPKYTEEQLKILHRFYENDCTCQICQPDPIPHP